MNQIEGNKEKAQKFYTSTQIAQAKSKSIPSILESKETSSSFSSALLSSSSSLHLSPLLQFILLEPD
jgi:hypothetical protein